MKIEQNGPGYLPPAKKLGYGCLKGQFLKLIFLELFLSYHEIFDRELTCFLVSYFSGLMAIVGRMDFLKVQLCHQFHRQSIHVFDLKVRKGKDILK